MCKQSLDLEASIRLGLHDVLNNFQNFHLKYLRKMVSFIALHMFVFEYSWTCLGSLVVLSLFSAIATTCNLGSLGNRWFSPESMTGWSTTPDLKIGTNGIKTVKAGSVHRIPVCFCSLKWWSLRAPRWLDLYLERSSQRVSALPLVPAF